MSSKSRNLIVISFFALFVLVPFGLINAGAADQFSSNRIGNAAISAEVLHSADQLSTSAVLAALPEAVAVAAEARD